MKQTKQEKEEEKKKELAKKKSEEIKRKKAKWLLILILSSVILLLILIIALPTKTINCDKIVTKTENVPTPYAFQESYYDEIPYTATECNYENLGYNLYWRPTQKTCVQSYCNRWDFFHRNCMEEICQEYKAECLLIVKNLDNKEGGRFKLIGYGKDENGRLLPEKEKSMYISPQMERGFNWVYYYQPGESIKCLYKDFEPGTKQVCKEVIKTKNVLKTRPVTKYRNIEQTKYSQENYQKQVNWLFGKCD